MSKITYLKSAVKVLENYDQNTRKRIIESIEDIPQGDIKKLQSNKYPPLYRLRVGKYRIIYRLVKAETELVIAKIDTRGDVYK